MKKIIFSLLLLTACNSTGSNTVTFTKVLDPITYLADTGERIRLVGLRAPSASNPVQCYGPEALLAAESLLGEEVRLEKEPLLLEAEDGALPRYVFLKAPKKQQSASATGATANNTEEESSDEILINERALEMGTAFPLVSEEMVYGKRLLAAARYSSATKRGLWSACEVEAQEVPQGKILTTQPLDDCIIKGTVTEDGQRLYRTPSCSAYAQTLVIQKDGGQWFCAEDTAQAAGFVRGEDCG